MNTVSINNSNESESKSTRTMLITIISILGICLAINIFLLTYICAKMVKNEVTPKTATHVKKRSSNESEFAKHLVAGKYVLRQLHEYKAPKDMLDSVRNVITFCRKHYMTSKEFVKQYGETKKSIAANTFPFYVIKEEDLHPLTRQLPEGVVLSLIFQPSLAYPTPTILHFTTPNGEQLTIKRTIGSMLLNSFMKFSKTQAGLRFIATCRHIQYIQTHRVKRALDSIAAETEQWRMYIKGLQYLDKKGLSKTLGSVTKKIRSLHAEKPNLPYEEVGGAKELAGICPSLNHILGKPRTKNEKKYRCFLSHIASFFLIFQDVYKEKKQRRNAEIRLVKIIFTSQRSDCGCNDSEKPKKESSI